MRGTTGGALARAPVRGTVDDRKRGRPRRTPEKSSPVRALGALRAPAFALSATAPATAVTPGEVGAPTLRDGICEVGEFCPYHGSGATGSTADFGRSAPDCGTSR
ncbi:hypothetical protein [Umezawaea beigongshangensis]|uniref:hypothetical protein n=1 Tax=Umezawaea beigongshangensis TaxID=2780383 RepID=UPI0018F1E82F|nr:hypothetical protein [Umezawaea beigongshangensis]